MNDPSDSRREAPSEAPADAEPPQRLSIDIVVEGGDWTRFAPIDATILAACAAVASSPALSFGPSEACIALSSDAEVQALNSTYRGKDKPTNVLSFPAARHLFSSQDASRQLGDIVLAAGTVAREAAELRISPHHHLQHLVVHGLLHLLGYDHEQDAAAEEMEGLETEILASIGVPDPYAGATGLDLPALAEGAA